MKYQQQGRRDTCSSKLLGIDLYFSLDVVWKRYQSCCYTWMYKILQIPLLLKSCSSSAWRKGHNRNQNSIWAEPYEWITFHLQWNRYLSPTGSFSWQFGVDSFVFFDTCSMMYNACPQRYKHIMQPLRLWLWPLFLRVSLSQWGTVSNRWGDTRKDAHGHKQQLLQASNYVTDEPRIPKSQRGLCVWLFQLRSSHGGGKAPFWDAVLFTLGWIEGR